MPAEAKGVRSPGARVTGNCESPDRVLGIKPGPKEEQPVRLTTKMANH